MWLIGKGRPEGIVCAMVVGTYNGRSPKIQKRRDLSVSALRKSEALRSVVKAIELLEIRADKCYRDLSLLGLPWNLAAWAAMTEWIRVVEKSTPSKGSIGFRLREWISRYISSAIMRGCGR